MRSACLGWLVAALGLTPFTATPASYTLVHTTLDAGGGFATSDHYRLDASIGEPRGISRSASGDTEDRQGFVASLNDPPVPGADTFQRTSGQPGKVRLAILLANDQDPEGDRLTLTLADGRTAEGGTVGLDEGWLVYDPPVSSPEADQFRYVLEDEAGNVTTAWVTVLVAGTGLQPSLNLIATTILPNGHLRLTFAGIAGRPYRIEWTDQLPALQWNTLATIAADARGIIEWVDATEPRPAQRYYRTVGQ